MERPLESLKEYAADLAPISYTPDEFEDQSHSYRNRGESYEEQDEPERERREAPEMEEP